MNWSAQQQQIFEWFENRDRQDTNLVVVARAGTGKTTTIIEAVAHAPEQQILLAAFNKEIAEELNRRLRNPRAVAKTLHSVGFTIVRQAWRGVRVDADRGWSLARRVLAPYFGGLDRVPDPMTTIVSRLASLLKNTCFTAPTVDEVVDLAYTHNIVPDNGGDLTVEDIAQYALDAAGLAMDRDGTIDFDDMVFLPVVMKWARPEFDLIVVDEAQDMNAVQLELAMRVARGRIAVVGDDKQAIYAFRGADSNAIDRLRQRLSAVTLPLTITYRCGSSIVALAQPLCPDFEAAPGAHEGSVQETTEEQMLKTVEPTDFVLSRVNAPLARICLTLIRQGTPARIQGRDIAKTLTGLVRKQRQDLIPDLLVKLYTWRDREAAKVSKTNRASAQARIDYLHEQVETIEALSDGLAETAELLTRIDELFADGRGPAVVCSSIHRAKGLEAHRVFLLADTLYCGGKRVNEEERNIHYVGITRAKETLMLVKQAPENSA